jgi:hypothetical protein
VACIDKDNLKNKSLKYSEWEDWFAVDDERFQFAEISAFFRTSTDHYFNRVYQGSSLRIVLKFTSGPEAVVYEVDSNHQDHYRLLHRLAEAIEAFRRQRIEADYRGGKKIGFALQGDAKPLTMKGTDLLYGDEPVEALRFSPQDGTTVVDIVLPGKTIEVIVSNVSDSGLFVELARQVVPSSVKSPSRTRVWLNRVFLFSVVCFGVNGWLDEYALALWMSNPLVEGGSVVARIILAVAIVLGPVFWLVHRFNQKMIARLQVKLKAME